MKKKTISILTLIILLATMFMPNIAYAESSVTHDYKDLTKLDSDYSYSTLIWSDDTEVKPVEGNTAELYDDTGDNVNERVYVINESENLENQKICIKVTNCAIDKNGKKCDAIFTVYGKDITPFTVKGDIEDKLQPEGWHVDLSFNKYVEYKKRRGNEVKESNLLRVWYQTDAASSKLEVKYVLHDNNNEKAEINKMVVTMGDMDYHTTKQSLNEEKWGGCEGFTISSSSSEVYYKKDNWLRDTEGEKGVRTPAETYGINQSEKESEGRPSNVKPAKFDTDVSLYNSAVVTENRDDATLDLFYSGFHCGIMLLFAAPYSYELEQPVKTALNANNNEITDVKPGDEFNYQIEQKVPNNIMGSEYLNIFEDEILNDPTNTDYNDYKNIMEGYYDSFSIEDQLNEYLELNGDVDDVIVKKDNESTEDFTVSKDNNKITATANKEVLTDDDFYGHTYTVTIPVKVKSSLKDVGTILNQPITTVKGNNEKTTETIEGKEITIKTSYRVTFITKGGSDIDPNPQIVEYNQKATEPTAPTKEGHIFGGWYTDEAMNTEYKFKDTPVTQDITLYAKWTKDNEYPIEYYVDDLKIENSGNPSTYTFGNPVTFKKPTKEGYEFDGWYEDSDLTIPKAEISATETGPKKVYGKWVKNDNPETAKYKVNYYKETTNGNYELAVTDTKTGTIGQTVTADLTTKFEGYTLNLDHDSTKKSGEVSADNDLVLRLYYDKNNYKVTFDTKGGSTPPETQTVKYLNKATKPSDPTKEGYIFKYWYYIGEDNKKMQYDFDDPVTKDVNLIAEWEKIKTTTPNNNTPTGTTNTTGGKVDNSTSNKTLPDTGLGAKIIISFAIAVAIVMGIRYHRFKDIM